MRRASAQHGFGGMQIGLHDRQRLFGKAAHTDHTRQMEDQVATLDHLLRHLYHYLKNLESYLQMMDLLLHLKFLGIHHK